MSLDLFEQSFCYGNIQDVHNGKSGTDVFNKLIKAFKVCNKERDPYSYWNLVKNTKILGSRLDIDYLKFIAELFDILDDIFPPNYNIIDFSNPTMIKVFIVEELLYTIDALIVTRSISAGVTEYFNKHFRDILAMITTNNIMTDYIVATEHYIEWRPSWKICYADNTLYSNKVDIYNDNILMYPKIKYEKNTHNVLEKVIRRLKFLKENAGAYYDFLYGTGVIARFTHHVFDNFPYYEIYNHYLLLVELCDDTYLPEGIDRDKVTSTDLLFEILPSTFSSYIMGFPVNSIGKLTRDQIRKFAKEMHSDSEKHFDYIKSKNIEFINSRIFIRKIGNNMEGSTINNLLFTPVIEYNSDDVMILFSNGVYFLFNYPEYAVIIKNQINPYNREPIDYKYVCSMSFFTDLKKDMIKTIRERGLKLELGGTMKENFDDLLTSIKEYKPQDSSLASSGIISLLFGDYFLEETS